MANFRRVVPGFMEEKTRVIVVMRSRYTLCIKDAVMASVMATFRIVVLECMEDKTREIVVMRSRYTLCIKDAVMANRVVLDLRNLWIYGGKHRERLW